MPVAPIRTLVFAAVASSLSALAAFAPSLSSPAASRGSSSCAPNTPTVFTGRVIFPDGARAARAVVVTSAGGQAVTGLDGEFDLEVDVPRDAKSVRVTAVTESACSSVLAATANIAAPARRTARAGNLVLASAACQASWLPSFGGQPGLCCGGVEALAVFDDGTGPALYVGGALSSAGGAPQKGVAKWNGSTWSQVGSWALSGLVQALAVFDDGSGPALYAGGSFSPVHTGVPDAWNIARWNGSTWSAVGGGFHGGASLGVAALTVFDGGSGPALYAGGDFTTAGPSAQIQVLRIAKWSGTAWSAVGGGMDSYVRAFTVLHSGSGSTLFAAGAFTMAGGASANRIAQWNGSTWSALGSGLGSGAAIVNALAVYDDGSGPKVVAAGDFTTPASGIAKWNGSSWSPLGAGISGNVFALAAFDDGSGPALFAGGQFATAGGAPANRIAKWNGSSWSALPQGLNALNSYVEAFAVFDDGSGPALWVGGAFNVSPSGVFELAKWGGCPPSALPGLQPYGTGTPGCQGTETCSASSAPTVGNAGFQITCDKAPASALGLGLVTNTQDLAGYDVLGLGVLLHVDLLSATQVLGLDFSSNASGNGTASAPIPNHPLLVGQKIYAQAIWYWAGACALPGPFSLSSSRGLEITFLP